MAEETPQAVNESKMRVLETFMGTMCSNEKEVLELLSGLTGRLIIRSTVLALWSTYLQGNFEENGFDKDQFDILFFKHDASKEPLADVNEILKLMATGKKNGDLPKEGPINFFPCGFWKMPEIKWELTNQTMAAVTVLLKALCHLHYEMPADWKDDKHPEGLFMDIDEQVKNLSKSLIERAGEIEMAEAELEAEAGNEETPEGQTEATNSSEDSAPDSPESEESEPDSEEKTD